MGQLLIVNQLGRFIYVLWCCCTFLLISGCAYVVDYSDRGMHETFLNDYGSDVGNHFLNSTLNRYPRFSTSKGMISKRYELYEFKTFRGAKCRIFYIVDSSNSMVTGWYFDGTEKSCYSIAI